VGRAIGSVRPFVGPSIGSSALNHQLAAKDINKWAIDVLPKLLEKGKALLTKFDRITQHGRYPTYESIAT